MGDGRSATADGKPATIYDVAARAGVSKSLVSLVLQRPRRSATSAARPSCGPSRNSTTARAPRPCPSPAPAAARSASSSTTSATSGSSTCSPACGRRCRTRAPPRRRRPLPQHRARRLTRRGLPVHCATRHRHRRRARHRPRDPGEHARRRRRRSCGDSPAPTPSRTTTAPVSDGRRAPARARPTLRIGFVGGRSAASAERLTGLEARITSAHVARPLSHPRHAVEPPPRRPAPRPSGTCSTPTPTSPRCSPRTTSWRSVRCRARRTGLRVPEDVSVMGYDDTPLAASSYVGLTSIDTAACRSAAAPGSACSP